MRRCAAEKSVIWLSWSPIPQLYHSCRTRAVLQAVRSSQCCKNCAARCCLLVSTARPFRIMALGYIRPLSGSTSIQAERQIPETHHWQRYWRHRRNRGDHFGNCPVCGTYLDMRGIDQVLVHVHDAEIET